MYRGHNVVAIVLSLSVRSQMPFLVLLRASQGGAFRDFEKRQPQRRGGGGGGTRYYEVLRGCAPGSNRGGIMDRGGWEGERHGGGGERPTPT